MEKGVYQLNINIEIPITLRVGKLGVFRFKAGNYLYTGRASRGLKHRIARHLKVNKPLHWHIDYLLANKNVKITSTEIVADDPDKECSINKKSFANGKYMVLIPGFGASDCQGKCSAHLIWESL